MATTGKAYNQGRRDAFKECYDLLSEIMKKRDGFVNHVGNGKVKDYCPCEDLRTLGLTLLSLSSEDSRNGKD